jgi:hypothetical protein
VRVAFVFGLFLALVAFAVLGGEHRFRLGSYQWKQRLLLVFAPSAHSASYLRQRAHYDLSGEGFRSRDLLFVSLIPGETQVVGRQKVDLAAQDELRRQFDIEPDDFAVLLVGKDGGVKLRSTSPVAPDELFPLIDSMPMRQQELRKQSAAGATP